MSILRSEPMSYCMMYVQPENAFEIFEKLGDLSRLQVEDMTPEISSFQRPYISELCRYGELERILNYIKSEIARENLNIPQCPIDPPALKPVELNYFENMLIKSEIDIGEMSKYYTQLLKNQQQLQELSYVLRNVDPIIGDAEIRGESIFKATTVQGAPAGEPLVGGKLHIRTGVVRRSKAFAFELMLWRISRGNIFFRPANMDQLFEDPATGTMVRKVAFVAVAQGSQLMKTMDKAIAGFHATVYPCPPTYAQRRATISSLNDRMIDLNQVLMKTKYHRCKQFLAFAKQWERYFFMIKKSKAIYNVMNHFSMDITSKALIGKCWCPTQDLNEVQGILYSYRTKGVKVNSFLSVIETLEEPPTYFRTNKFSMGFQALICAYGDAKYRELNPGLYTVVTFPFLFSIMFGDCGHGLIMFAFSLWMIIKEKKLMENRTTNEIWNIMFGGRYVMFLMSLATGYSGFMYNDWFSKPLCLMDSYWMNTFSKDDIQANEFLTLDPRGKTKSWYYFGVDPAWMLSTNKIMFANSLKMKMSIVLGIIHMMFGLWLSLFNHIYFKHYFAIFLEFIPQLMFLTCLFMWLVFLIFFKWIAYGPKEKDIKNQPGCAPLILIIFIDMCLCRTTVVEEGSVCDPYMFPNQQTIQQVLLLLAIVNVPIMLFGTPVYKHLTNKKKRRRAFAELERYQEEKEGTMEPGDKNEKVLIARVETYSASFGELMIHQGVHTIEYVLSTISHTASYLRLWALSLAHAELSEMLWEMVLAKLALHDHSRTLGPLRIYLIFAIWAFFSVAILVVMEGLSAFLHTLRLHWVEFMSKFFIGGGEPFHPFDFQEILHGDHKEETKETCPPRKDVFYL